MLKKFIYNYPALIILFVILTGVFFYSVWNFDLTYTIITLSSILLLSLICFISNFIFSAKYLLGFGIGIGLGFQIQQTEFIFPEKRIPEMKAVFSGKVQKITNKSEKIIKVIVHGDLDAQRLEKLTNTSILLNIFTSNKSININQGEHIYCKMMIKFPQKNRFNSTFDEKKYLKALDVQFVGFANSKDVAIMEPPSLFDNFINSIVSSIDGKISLLFVDNSRAIVKAIVLGNKTELTYEQKQIFSYSGTAHILAVSGLHTSIIAGMIFVLLGFVRNRYLKLIFFTISILLFTFISGLQDSAIRAALLSIAILFAYTFQKRYNLINLLSYIVIFVIIFNPNIIHSAGFQMSVVSVFGILIFYNSVKNFINQFIQSENLIINFVINSIAITISASITISPIIAYYFGIYSIVSPLANLLVIPLFTFTLIFSIISIIFSFISMPIAEYYAATSSFLIDLSEKITSFSVSLPYSYLDTEIIFPISIIVSILLIYIILSNELKTTFFRIVVSFFILTCFVILLEEKDDNKLSIISGNQYSALVMPLKYNNTYILIADRKPSQTPKRDFEFEQYLLGLNRKLIIGYTGNSGIKLCDELKKITHIKEKEVRINQIHYLKEKLNLPRHLPQIIEY